MDYPAAKAFILNELENNLSDQLYYHGVHHTLDVLQRTVELCHAEAIAPSHTTLLKTAALFHDSGFLIRSAEHEQLGCDIVCKHLPQFHYTTHEIDLICGMIRATKVPQNPQTHFEAILCDADLDYLGRDDFKRIGDTLFKELKTFNLLNTVEEWNKMQVAFLEKHAFFTNTNLVSRKAKKQKHLEKLKEIVAQY